MLNAPSMTIARIAPRRQLGHRLRFPALVIPMVVGAMLPVPVINIRSAGFGFGTLAAPLILGFGILVARARQRRLVLRYVPLFLLLMSVGVLSVWNSWLNWNPNVGTSPALGYGHRWIVYQLTGLYFLATPFIAYAAGMAYGQLESLGALYAGVMLSVTTTTLVGLWGWWHNPVNPIDVYTKGVRPNINPDATLFLITLSAGVLLWRFGRWRTWIPALVLFALGLVAAFLSYALNVWVGAFVALTLLVATRWGWKGIIGWVGGLGLFSLAVQSTIGTIIDQRLASQDVDRIGLWHSALIVWSKSPLIGVGPGNLPSYMERFSVFGIGLVLQGYQQAHNIFLELLAENGVIGLGLFLLFLILVITQLLRRVPGSPPRFTRHFRAVALAMLVGSATMASVGSGIVPTIATAGWSGIPPVLVVWLFAGAATAIGLKRLSLVGPAKRRQLIHA